MSQPRYIMILLAAAGGGLAGGALAVRLFPVAPVFAEERRTKVIEAEEFRVVGKDGQPCGRFHVDRDGRPALFLFDKHGEVRAVLGVTPSGSPHLALSDKYGKVRATLGVWPDQSTALYLSDKDGKTRVTAAVSADGSPSLAVSDRDGNVRAVVGSASLDMSPARDFKNRSESSVALFDHQGKLMWSAP
jgi:hypothetical protein